jgi:UDP-glucose 4-epimerase
MKKIQEGSPIEIFGDGKQTRDFIFVKETASFTLKLSENENAVGRTINLASGRETAIIDLVRMMLKIMDKEDYPIVYKEPRPGDLRRHSGGMKLARELAGFEPKTPLEEGLRETIGWYLGERHE